MTTPLYPARTVCTCAPSTRVRQMPHGTIILPAAACPACRAWDRGRVLLRDGTTMGRMTWVDAHTESATEEDDIA